MAYTPIDKSDDYFNTLIYTGNGTSGRSVTGVGFKPDWVWIKNRSDADPHKLFDIVRGVSKSLKSNSTDAEVTNEENGYVSAFNTDGFTLTAGSTSQQDVNNSGENYVAWNWLASNTTASNTDGSITSTVSVNTTSGFSVVSYTGTGSTATIGHGLGVTPAMIIVKDRTNSGPNWVCWNKNFSNLTNDYIILNLTNSKGSFSNYWGSSAPTSSVFGVGSGGLDNNRSSANIIAYCFAEIKGFSKFGSYTGNGSADGPFIYTGFKPAFLIIKRTDAADGWIMFDNKRSSFNIVDKNVQANSSNSETTFGYLDFTSNGFKLRMNGASANGSSMSYIYMAFAENPFVTSTGIPACAR